MSVLKRRVLVNLAAGEGLRVDSEQSLVSFIVVSVQQGVLDVWYSDNPDGVGQPDLSFTPVGHPVTVPLPTGLTVFTAVGVEALNIGTINLMAQTRYG